MFQCSMLGAPGPSRALLCSVASLVHVWVWQPPGGGLSLIYCIQPMLSSVLIHPPIWWFCTPLIPGDPQVHPIIHAVPGTSIFLFFPGPRVECPNRWWNSVISIFLSQHVLHIKKAVLSNGNINIRLRWLFAECISRAYVIASTIFQFCLTMGK